VWDRDGNIAVRLEDVAYRAGFVTRVGTGACLDEYLDDAFAAAQRPLCGEGWWWWGDGWGYLGTVRSTGDAISKQRYDLAERRFVDTAYVDGSDGMAHSVNIFAHGAERAVYHCTEIDKEGRMLGPRLVAKQTRFEELMRATDFHATFCRVQAGN
jgi:hypothetical protein